MKRLQRLRGTLRMAVPYMLAGLLWFSLVSALSHALVNDALLEHVIEAVGGMLFVLASVAGAIRLLHRGVERLRHANETLEERVSARTEDLRREVAERARAEEVLRQSEQRFRDVAEAASDWFWEAGPDLRLTYVSRRFSEVTGLPAEMLVGQPAEGMIDAAGQSVQALYMTNRRPFRDVAVRLGERHILLSGRPVVDGVGGFCGYRGTGTDVTEHRRAELAADRLRRRHEAILNALGEGVFGFDRGGHVTFLNPAAREMLGWTEADLAARPLHETLHRGSPDAEYCSLYRVLAGKGAMRSTGEVFQRQDGTTFPVEIICTPLTEDGIISGAVAVFHDITERLETERQLTAAKDMAEQATRAKSDFLAHMSHELRTPLNAVIGFSDVILSETFGPIGNERYRDYLGDIRRSGLHLLDLIDDILDLSKIEAGKLELQEKPVDVSQLVSASLAMIRQEAERTGCRLVDNVPGNLPPILADSRRVTQVLINLLSNAVKFTPRGGTVTVAAAVDGDGRLTLEVSDTGIGIPAEDLPRVTDVFVSGNIAVARELAGAGLGLPLAKRLVELHGGQLELCSAVNEGTTVRVSFPPTRLVTGERARV